MMDFKDKSCDMFRLFNNRRSPVAAGRIAMTIDWGGMGALWGPSRTMFTGEIADVTER